MPNYTDSHGFYKNSAGFTSSYTHTLAHAVIDLDFAKIAAARSAAGAAALVATDTLVVGILPKGAYVLAGGAVLVRPEGAAGTIDVGIGGSTIDYWLDAFDLNGAVGLTAANADAAQLYCTANTNILMTVNTNNIDAARVKLLFSYVNLGADLGVIPNVT